MAKKTDSQRLVGTNLSPDLAEGLEMRVADPFWFLARQWQFGEFEAEDGGRVAQVSMAAHEIGFDRVILGETRRPIDPSAPLEAVIEAETAEGRAPGWNSQRLSYDAVIEAGSLRLTMRGYDGRALDWHDFDLATTDRAPAVQRTSFTAMPAQLAFKGAPDPRTWQIEEGAAYFDGPFDPEPNALSMLLPEFFYADVRNWLLVPAPMRAGGLRKIDQLSVVDSFGVVTEAQPAITGRPGEDWAIFAPGADASAAGQTGAERGATLDGSWLLVPNIAPSVLDNDLREEVRFLRDEDANLVWAWERVLTDATGITRTTDTEMPPERPDTTAPGEYFTLKSNTARAWIPYVPRQTATNPAVEGDISLRRGRTDQAATAAAPQHRSQVVSETKHLDEEQVPPNGLRVRRIARYARGADGKAHFWTGRDRDITPRPPARPCVSISYAGWIRRWRQRAFPLCADCALTCLRAGEAAIPAPRPGYLITLPAAKVNRDAVPEMLLFAPRISPCRNPTYAPSTAREGPAEPR